MNYLVAHPSRQHAHRLAHALSSTNQLAAFVTLLPDKRSLRCLPSGLHFMIPQAVFRHSLDFLPEDKVEVLLGPLLLLKGTQTSPLDWVRQSGELLTWKAFDSWVARRVKVILPTGLVGYEMCCLSSFIAAKSLGIKCILDAAAFHYELQNRVLGTDKLQANSRPRQAIVTRKRREIELADHIICVSEAAAKSYVEAGVDPKKISINEVGCDTSLFSALFPDLRRGPPKFLFVGLPVFHKGFDILISSFRELATSHPDAELHIAGDISLITSPNLCHSENIVLHGKLSQRELAELYSQMDCLVLPSRLDSFGMVVVEALASGLPVIVSSSVGASSVIIEGKNGWVVPMGSEDELHRCLYSVASQISLTRAMRSECVASAEKYDWENYSKRSLKLFNSF